MTTPGASDSVRQLMLRRIETGSRPGRRQDGAVLGLCIEGGAMRGVVSAGMVVAFEQLGCLNVFDYVFGSSAGAMNGAYFLAGQAAFGTTIYYENINNANFIDFRRPLRGRPIVDLDYLVDDVMRRDKRLDVDAVMRSPVPLRAIATQVRSAGPQVFGDWKSSDDLLRTLRAGATMPIVAGPPFKFQGEEYWDALLTEPVPIESAADAGCTHLVALLTRPRGKVGPKISLAERIFIVPKLRAYSNALADKYVVRGQEYSASVEAAWAGGSRKGRVPVLAIGPSGPSVGKLERDRDKLVAGALAGMNAVLDVFGSELRGMELIAATTSNGHPVNAVGKPNAGKDEEWQPTLKT